MKHDNKYDGEDFMDYIQIVHDLLLFSFIDFAGLNKYCSPK